MSKSDGFFFALLPESPLWLEERDHQEGSGAGSTGAGRHVHPIHHVHTHKTQLMQQGPGPLLNGQTEHKALQGQAAPGIAVAFNVLHPAALPLKTGIKGRRVQAQACAMGLEQGLAHAPASQAGAGQGFLDNREFLSQGLIGQGRRILFCLLLQLQERGKLLLFPLGEHGQGRKMGEAQLLAIQAQARKHSMLCQAQQTEGLIPGVGYGALQASVIEKGAAQGIMVQGEALEHGCQAVCPFTWALPSKPVRTVSPIMQVVQVVPAVQILQAVPEQTAGLVTDPAAPGIGKAGHMGCVLRSEGRSRGREQGPDLLLAQRIRRGLATTGAGRATWVATSSGTEQDELHMGHSRQGLCLETA